MKTGVKEARRWIVDKVTWKAKNELKKEIQGEEEGDAPSGKAPDKLTRAIEKKKEETGEHFARQLTQARCVKRGGV